MICVNFMFDWDNANTLKRDQKIWGDLEKSPSQNPPLNVQSSSPVAACLVCSNHLGVHQSLSFFPLKGFLNSLCLFSSASFCFAASSSSPFSNALIITRHLSPASWSPCHRPSPDVRPQSAVSGRQVPAVARLVELHGEGGEVVVEGRVLGARSCLPQNLAVRHRPGQQRRML